MPIFHMVVTTCLGNVFGTVALMNEGAEPHLMRRSPRDIKIHSLLDVGLLLHAFIYGNLIAFALGGSGRNSIKVTRRNVTS
eukprot:gene34431-42464_t